MPSSKHEELCRTTIEDMLGVKFPSTRPKFLTNPETGHCLELDGYNKKLRIAFEAQGRQHYVFSSKSPLFYKEKKDWVKQIRRDDYKKRVCNVLNIDLILIPYDCKSTKDIYERLKRKLKHRKLKINPL